jgi:hypothetical protein
MIKRIIALIFLCLCLPIACSADGWFYAVGAATGTETVGTTAEGASAATMTANSNGISGAYFTPGHSGTLTTISMYSFNTSTTVDLQWGLFEYTSGTDPDASTLVGTETQIVNPGTWDDGSSGPIWKDFTVSYAVVAGHHYYIGWNTNENSVVTYRYSEPGGTQGYYRTNNFGTAWADPFGVPSTSTRLRSIKGTIVY